MPEMSSLSRGKSVLKLSLNKHDEPTKKKRRSPLGWAEFWCEAGLDQEGLKKTFISKYIGFGVIANTNFKKGDFILEYVGERIDGDEAKIREEEGDCYIFGYKYNDRFQWIDASNTVCERLGGLVNDAEEGTKECNCKMKLTVVNNSSTQDCAFFPSVISSKGRKFVMIMERSQRSCHGLMNLVSNERRTNMTEIWDDDPFDVEKDKQIMKEVARQERELKKIEKQELAKKKQEDQIADTQEEAGQDRELTGKKTQECGKKKRKKQMADTQEEAGQDRELTGKKTQECGKKKRKKQMADTQEEAGQDKELTEKEEQECGKNKQEDQMADTQEEAEQDRELTEREEQECGKKNQEDQMADTQEETGQDRELTGNEEQECGKKKRKKQMADTQEEAGQDRELTENEEQECGKKKRKKQMADTQWCTVDLKDLSFTGLIRKKTNTMPSDDEDYDNSDDPDYKVENSESEEDDSESDCTEKIYPMIIKKQALNLDTSPNIELEDTDKKLQNEEKNLITVMGTSGTEDGYRVYDKKMYCPYCSKPQSKLPRHLISRHGKETEVIKYEIEKDKGKKEKMICKLRNLGNYLHNNEVMKEGKGILVVKYRPSEESSWEDYVPCDLCLGYYVHWDIWKHRNRCVMKPENKATKGRVVNKCRLLIQNNKSTKTTSELDQILASLTNDNIGKVVKRDTMILQLGEKLSKKVGHDADQFSCVRNTLRELGRLLIRLREIVEKEDAELAEFLHPSYFKTVVQATKDVAGYDEITHLLKTPSLSLKIGTSLRNCATIRKRTGLEELDDNLVKESSYFDQLCEENWAEEISTHALRTLGENKRNKAKLIPLTSNCQILTDYLKEKGKDAYQALEISNRNTEAYKDLCEVALTQIILFNRRRQEEVSKMKMEDCQNIQKENQNDVQDSLSALERKLCKSLTRVEIVGKRGRTVPVILTALMKKWLDLLVQTRQKAGVAAENKFVFARSGYGSLDHIRGSDCLRKFSVECGAKQPNLLRSTKLRKQIATLSQILNLKENELDILANFLGHDVRIHREFYRLPQHTLEIAKVSKLLISLENGEFSGLGGKSLAEIEVNLDEEIGVDVDESSDNEELGDGEDSSDNEDDAINPEANKKHKNRGGAKDKAESKNERTGTDVERARNVTDHNSHRKFKARPWSEMEKTAVLRHFRSHIVLAKIPKKEESEKCIKKEPCLSTRTWKNVKDFVRNRIISTKNRSAEVF